MRVPNKVDISGVLATGRPLVVDTLVAVPSFGSYSFGRGAHVVLDVHRIDRGLGVAGSIDVTATGACDRCLGDVSKPFSLQVDEVFSAEASGDALGESNVLDGSFLDVADLVRQVIDSAVPLVLLCSDDCRGLCASCGLPWHDGLCAAAPIER